MSNEIEDLLESIQNAAKRVNGSHLTYDQFRKLTGRPMSQIHKHFDSWKNACEAVGVTPGRASPANLTPKHSKGKEHALSEVKRVAQLVGATALSKSEFDRHKPDVKASTVARLWNGWDNALKAAGLGRHSQFASELSLDTLAEEFLRVTRELSRVPTIQQLSRRSLHCKNSFTRKFGGYIAFKTMAIRLLLADELSEWERLLFQEHVAALEKNATPLAEVTPHHRGRHLGFRAFAFAPTYEAEVVSLFACVADELGFEIVAQRSAFPDCEARRLVDRRRKRYEKCLIEFELHSSDYRNHRHPMAGCDLVVCWEHDWIDCPLSVLELSSAIRRLPGWK